MANEEGQTRCRFDLNEGNGTALKELPCFQSVGKRGKAATALEGALDFVHGCVYGRRGVTGERRTALSEFKGFPARMEAEVTEKLKRQERAKLSAMAKALGINTSQARTRDALAQTVASFLMSPKDDGSFATAGAPSARGTKRARSTGAEGGAEGTSGRTTRRRTATASRTRKTSSTSRRRASPRRTASTTRRSPKTARRASARRTSGKRTASPRRTSRHATPSDESVQVVVFQRVLGMPSEQRMQLGLKALRTELEQHFGLAEGALKERKMLIATTASDCVRALYEAECGAIAAMQDGVMPPDRLPVADALLTTAEQDDTPSPTPIAEKEPTPETATHEEEHHHHHHHRSNSPAHQSPPAHETEHRSSHHTSRERSPGTFGHADTAQDATTSHQNAPFVSTHGATATDHRSVFEQPRPYASHGSDNGATHADSASHDLYQTAFAPSDQPYTTSTRSPPRNLGYDASTGPHSGAGGMSTV